MARALGGGLGQDHASAGSSQQERWEFMYGQHFPPQALCKLVGRESVVAGADCGFSSQAMYHTEVHPTVVWAIRSHARWHAAGEQTALAVGARAFRSVMASTPLDLKMSRMRVE
jgi:hypothetical protein